MACSATFTSAAVQAEQASSMTVAPPTLIWSWNKAGGAPPRSAGRVVIAAAIALSAAFTTPKPKQRRRKSMRANRMRALDWLAFRHSVVVARARARAPSGILREEPTS